MPLFSTEYYQKMLAVRESFTKDPSIVPLPDAEYATYIWPAGILNSFTLTQLKVNIAKYWERKLYLEFL